MTPKLIDLAEYERVGEGANGASYNHRQDPNIMLKLYFRNFEAAELELELARKVYEMGIPTPETHPVAYQDMIETRDKKGTRFVFHADASNYNHKFTVGGVSYDLSADRSEEAIRAYARWVCDTVIKTGLDGADFDYEGWSGQHLNWAIEECDRIFGLVGQYPEKLIIVDYFSVSPPVACDPFVDYYVKQAYSQQGAGVGAMGHPDEKTVYCESFGQKPTGGEIFNYAAWEPATGHKGGCGAYYVERNYYNTSDGVPYGAIRRAIQIMNPAR